MISVNPWRDSTFDTLYSIFTRDFKETQPIYEGKAVLFFPEMENGKELIFWHLTHSEDKITRERLPDLRRAERLPWVRKVIDNADKPEVLAWDYTESDRSIHTYIWLKEHDFLVIMKKYPDASHRIITAYYIDYLHTRTKLEKKYRKRLTRKE
jgi:hypothetical protein